MAEFDADAVWLNHRDENHAEVTGPNFSFHGWVQNETASWYGDGAHEPQRWLLTLIFPSKEACLEAAKRALGGES